MTLETCKIRYDLAIERGDNKEAEFWKERILRKSRHPKYAGIDIDKLLGVKKDGKKSKG